ncbi:MAG: hypothetical protein BWY00_01811 [Firmicutes bacterium ADurb.Bin153]|nr:MAG: hypothetical protein BWY00_01811 [Firmicutes bacterium ADurb.Bin153]
MPIYSLARGGVHDLQLIVIAHGHDRVPAQHLVPRAWKRYPAVFGIVDGVVHREAEHGRDLGRKAGLDRLEHLLPGRPRRVEADVLQGLEVLGKGIAEGRGLGVEAARAVGPVLLGRHAEEHHGLHGGADVRPGVALEPQEVPRGLVEEEARGIDVPAEGLALAVLQQPHPGVGRARAQVALVLHRGAPLLQAHRCGQLGLCRVCGPCLDEHGMGRILLPQRCKPVRNAPGPHGVVTEVRIVGEPAHGPEHTSACLVRFHSDPPYVYKIAIVSKGLRLSGE